MKKLLIAFMVSVYFVPTSVFLAMDIISKQGGLASAAMALLIVPVIFMVIVCALVLANMVVAIVAAVHAKHLSFKAIMIYKLCFIPFYIVNFACWAIASVVFHIAIIVWPMIPFIIAYTYFTMIGTSVYNITHLVALRKDNLISTKKCVLHSILQCIFMVDVIDAIYLVIKNKKFITQIPTEP